MKIWTWSIMLTMGMLTIGARHVRAQEATLTSAEAIFETLDNDKDHDSIVCVAVKNGNTVIASSCNSGAGRKC